MAPFLNRDAQRYGVLPCRCASVVPGGVVFARLFSGRLSAASVTPCGPLPPAPSEPPIAVGPVPPMAEGQGGTARREGPREAGGDLYPRTAVACERSEHPEARGGTDGAGGGGVAPSCSVGEPGAVARGSRQVPAFLFCDDVERVRRPHRHNIRLSDQENGELLALAASMRWPPSKLANRLLGAALRAAAGRSS